ncbi:MAG: DsbA family oxidoreductase [Alphaproteobacteria bacterium]|nr:DsbA family oxidoreductase [Alphaproteobacteria bacterium]
MQIDVISDTVCPWCYIGKRRLGRALAARPELDVSVRWRPYQLDPTIPPGGVDRKEYLLAKFGPGERPKAMAAAIKEAGSEEGIDFAFDKIMKSPNTLNSHRLIRWAASAGVQDRVVDALFRRYFTQGEDIGDIEVLIDVARECWMDTDLVRELMTGDADADLVRREDNLARRIGVEGVPAYIIADKYLLLGAQDPEVILRAIDKALEKVAEDGA